MLQTTGRKYERDTEEPMSLFSEGSDFKKGEEQYLSSLLRFLRNYKVISYSKRENILNLTKKKNIFSLEWYNVFLNG